MSSRAAQAQRWAANMTDRFHHMLRYWQRPSWRMLIVVAPFMIGALFCIYAWYSDRVVARRQKTTSGTILVREPANHDRYGYTFKVDQKTYTGWQIPQDDEKFTVGQIVTVHYDPLDPNNSALVDYNELSSRALGPVPFLVAVVLFVAVFIFVRRAAPKSERLTPS
jgi:hypothetical protein